MTTTTLETLRNLIPLLDRAAGQRLDKTERHQVWAVTAEAEIIALRADGEILRQGQVSDDTSVSLRTAIDMLRAVANHHQLPAA